MLLPPIVSLHGLVFSVAVLRDLMRDKIDIFLVEWWHRLRKILPIRGQKRKLPIQQI